MTGEAALEGPEPPRPVGPEAGPVERILECIAQSPGLNIEEVAEETGFSRGTVRYHMRRLATDDLVVVHRHGNHRLHFSAGLPRMRRRAIALLRVESVRSIVEACLVEPAVAGAPQVRAAELADQTGMTVNTAYRSLKTLERAALVRRRRLRGRRGVYDVAVHPELRIAWVLYAKDAPRNRRPLHKSPGWLFGLELLFGKLALGAWSS